MFNLDDYSISEGGVIEYTIIKKICNNEKLESIAKELGEKFLIEDPLMEVKNFVGNLITTGVVVE